MSSNEQVDDVLGNCLCCAGETDHTINYGGHHINPVPLDKLAEWPYLVMMNFLVPESKKHPLVVALICDHCLETKAKIKYAMAGRDSEAGVVYERVSLDQLKDPEFYWPYHHPDRIQVTEEKNECPETAP